VWECQPRESKLKVSSGNYFCRQAVRAADHPGDFPALELFGPQKIGQFFAGGIFGANNEGDFVGVTGSFENLGAIAGVFI
jgi:hypothetical protein